MVEDRSELEQIELWSLRDLFDAAPASAGVVVEEVGSGTLFVVPGGPPVVFNRLLGFGLQGPVTDGELERLDSRARHHGQPFSVSLSPDAGDAHKRLLARGFSPGYAWMKFQRGVERPPRAHTELRIAPAEQHDGVHFASVVRRGFELPASLESWFERLPGRPGWQCLLAWDGPQPVAAGASFARDGLAWLGLGATLPSHRRWGAQGALLEAALSGLPARGVRRAVTETGERVAGRPSASYRNLLRYGFEEVYLRPNLRCPGFDARAGSLRDVG